MKFFIICICSVMLLFSHALADTCYPANVVEADASLRFHAQLRVTGLSCTSPQSHQTLFTLYQTFTSNNGDLLKAYQDTLTAYYAKKSRGDSAKTLHTRETELENEESLAAAKQGISSFCHQHGPDLQDIVQKSPGEVKQQIASFAASSPTSLKQCPATK